MKNDKAAGAEHGAPVLGAPQATSLACADEIFLRCAPELLKGEGTRTVRVMEIQWLRCTAAAVIDRDKLDLLEVLDELADALDANSKINKHTGLLQTYVDPEWFVKFQRALERHTGRRVEL